MYREICLGGGPEIDEESPSTLSFRDGPNGAKKGELPESTVVEKLGEDGDWSQLRTPADFVGWVATEFLIPA